MAVILPVKGWRYHPRFTKDIGQLIYPLLDDHSILKEKELHKNPYNSVHLYLPQDRQAKSIKSTLGNWKNNHILIQDRIPGIYIHYQYFKIPGQMDNLCKKGFIALIKAYDWEDHKILKHEEIDPKTVENQVSLLRKTGLLPSPTQGLYEDPSFHLEHYMDQAIKNPVYDFEDFDGTRHLFGIIHDANIIHHFIRHMKDRSIILADGHHRLASSIAYKNDCIRNNPAHNGKEAYNFHLMHFGNASSKNLILLPTHRLFKNLNLSISEILDRSKEYFSIKPLNSKQDLYLQNLSGNGEYYIFTGESAYKMTIKPELLENLPATLNGPLAKIDVTLLHYLFVEKTLNIPKGQQKSLSYIDYETNFDRCLNKVENREAEFAVFTRESKIEDIIKTSKLGHILPYKSTYFYPKTLSGLIFGSISAIDFKFPYQAFTQTYS